MEEEGDDIKLIPKQITEIEKHRLEQPITKAELDTALKALKNNKSPGPDEFSPEFYKHFWPEIGSIFLKYMNYSHKKGSLTSTILEGTITCLPKTGKSRSLIKNWRPISLLNTSYKLISTCITNRLRPLLKKLISPEQKGFLQGRSINECTRLMYDIIINCQGQQQNGLILLVDFEKAFDSISWSFINDSLKKFNFGANFISWINMFQLDSTSKLTLNGHFSSPFPLQRGCRQGDPISPYLFILCSEFLTLAFKNNIHLEGIQITNKEHKLCQYADDTSVFMKATEKNLKIYLDILQWFYRKSGLKINIKKTKVIRIGNIRETDRRFCKENNLDWVTSFVSLGINYDVLDMDNITNLNIEQKLPQMLQMIQCWSNRNITPIGRITVCKSLLISKITHILISLPTPTKELFDKLETILINFIWKNKRHEVSKKLLFRSTDQGGLNMIDIRQFEKALKLTWLRTFVKETPDWIEFVYKYRIDRLLQTDKNYHNTIFQNTHNHFWRSVILGYTTFYTSIKNETSYQIELTPIWGNPVIRVEFNSALFRANVRFLQDLYRGNNRLTLKELIDLTQTTIPFTYYLSLWKSVPST